MHVDKGNVASHTVLQFNAVHQLTPWPYVANFEAPYSQKLNVVNVLWQCVCKHMVKFALDDGMRIFLHAK